MMSENTETNSDQNIKITTIKKDKDPKRVLAGKRLSQISQQAKKDKMARQIQKEKEEESWNINYGYLFGAVSVIIAITSLYYARKDDIREEKQLARNNEVLEKKHVVIKNDKVTELDSLE